MANVQEPASLSQRVAQALGGGTPSKQNMSTYKSTPADNLKGQGGVGVTRGSTSGQTVKYKGAGNPNRSYPVNVINKARAKMGGH